MKKPEQNLSDPRYERQSWMTSIGSKGQEKLAHASVLVIGAGGLGSPLLMYLGAAGLGRIGIVDHDIVQLSNLNRQVLYTMDDLGKPKALIAKKRIEALNPQTQIIPHAVYLNQDNVPELLPFYDLVLDATDNYPTRYLISDQCTLHNIPLFFGSVSAWSGMFFSRIPHKEQPCFRCFYPHPLESRLAVQEKQKGIVGVTPGIIGSIMASQVIQFLCQGKHGLEHRFFWMDLERGFFMSYATQRHPKCTVCSS